MKLIDCDNLHVIPNRVYASYYNQYKCLLYNEYPHMLKLPFTRRVLSQLLHFNVISEYLGSHVYSLLNIPVHDTILGKYHGEDCVLCKDLAYPDHIVTFDILYRVYTRDTTVRSIKQLRSITQTIHDIKAIDILNTEDVLNHFFLQFVVDALIGMPDRSRNNWGFILGDNAISICPVFDNCCCLNNGVPDAKLVNISIDSFRHIALHTSNCFLNDNEVAIEPFSYIERNTNDSIIAALQILDQNLFGRLCNLIDSLGDLISPVRNKWYKDILYTRLEKLLELKDKLC